MILKNEKIIITYKNQEYKLLFFKLAIVKISMVVKILKLKTIIIKNCKRLFHLININKYIQI